MMLEVLNRLFACLFGYFKYLFCKGLCIHCSFFVKVMHELTKNPFIYSKEVGERVLNLWSSSV